jgi:hypothetical protein
MRARDNPFASHRIEAMAYRPQGTSWQALLRRLEELRYRAAIVGPHGSGKTTLLEALAARLAALDFVPQCAFLNDRSKRLPPLGRLTRRHIVLLDGADHLPAMAWALLGLRLRTAGGLIITSHRAGMLPTLVQTTTSPNLLRELVQTLNPGQDRDIEALFRRHNGNVRNALRELYDQSAATPLQSLQPP